MKLSNSCEKNPKIPRIYVCLIEIIGPQNEKKKSYLRKPRKNGESGFEL